ncbi:MAG: hypothetical protein JW937_03120, partial [Candidatus Omnitrophica bacterium]|nr:hypothetical protein [Candidatus Omnitrophota bacterium]
SAAVAKRQGYALVFEADAEGVATGRYWIESQDGELLEKRYELPAGVEVYGADSESGGLGFAENRVVFGSTGAAREGGEIVLKDRRGRSRRLGLARLTGKVSISSVESEGEQE